MLVDSHCHLADEAFAADLDAVVARARGAGVDRALLVLAAGDAAEEARAARVLGLWPEVRVAIGVHPQSAGAFADAPDRAPVVAEEQLARTPLARAVGEIGLDYHYTPETRETQQAIFRAQLRLAARRRLPVVVHTRDAEADTLAMLREAAAEGPLRGVMHCFTGTVELAAASVELGLYVSFSGVLTFGGGQNVRDAARVVPLDRLLVETDCPYLAPVPHRGKRNEPAFVVRTADVLAALHGLAPAELAARTTANFEALFAP